MKKRRADAGLVVEYLENISRTAIKRYPEIITEYARRRSGFYALNKGEDIGGRSLGLFRNAFSELFMPSA